MWPFFEPVPLKSVIYVQFFANANGGNGSDDFANCSDVHSEIDYVNKWTVDDAVSPCRDSEPQRKL